LYWRFHHTNEVYNKTTNEKIISTEWHNLVVRNKAAEICKTFVERIKRALVDRRSQCQQIEDGRQNIEAAQ
jgi:single-strand DNA-binding protein